SPLSGLVNLRSLSIRGPRVSDVSVLASLTNLQTLDLASTNISRFPDFVLRLEHLYGLQLTDTPLRDLPKELLTGRDRFLGGLDDIQYNCLEAVRAHFADKAAGEEHDRELKLIVLGNARVGKSSILKRLIHDTFDPAEPSTHGIQLESWRMQCGDQTVQINA